ncbi:NUDIX domain-containing protein [Microbacterium sp. LRZ72]|uniref:NUDIX domain-containing protein n=1 Tax=Microbacterium sp. LRZ72 TaxID=2942481 RepID=UPI0029BE2937|nr:NUDIX domain-containing protein [Microbacterium sp. LRZ72]MDX2375670.1 NUDIX domain-containing protein [Microbacterium sp. LRZ72]
MRIEPPAPGEPRRPAGPRDPGDAWVVSATGERYWGTFGAAGLMAVDAARGVLLQHRVAWSHFGGTWGLPGGARHENESATDAALREAAEEAGVPAASVRPRLDSVLDLDIWSYTTLVADVIEPFDPVISDPESYALEWVPLDEVDDRPLHPGFGAAWPRLRAALEHRPTLVVDAANVVGSVPDGWWRDRAGAAGRLRAELERLAAAGVPASALGLPETRWFARIVLVLEGAARQAPDAGGAVEVVLAPGEGDDTIAAQAAERVEAGDLVTVVTSDRGLAARATSAGADVRGAGWLRELLDAL